MLCLEFLLDGERFKMSMLLYEANKPIRDVTSYYC